MDEQALEPETDEIRGKHGTGHYTGGRDMTATSDSSTVEKTKGTGGMTTCKKAQANTSLPEEARLRLPDPGHNLPRDGEPLASPFLASPSCLPSSCLSYSSSFLGFFLR